MKIPKLLFLLSLITLPISCSAQEEVSVTKEVLLEKKEEAKVSIEQAKEKLEYSQELAEKMQENKTEGNEKRIEVASDELVTQAKRNYEQEKKLANDMLKETKEKYIETEKQQN